MSSAEQELRSPEQKIHDARVYRRTWAAITAGCATVSAAIIKFGPDVPHHPHELQGPLGLIAVGTIGLTAASFTQILDGTELVGSRKNELERAGRYPEPDLEHAEDELGFTADES